MAVAGLKRQSALYRFLAEAERDFVLKTLRDVHGNRSEAARRLGVSRRYLYVFAKRHPDAMPKSEWTPKRKDRA